MRRLLLVLLVLWPSWAWADDGRLPPKVERGLRRAFAAAVIAATPPEEAAAMADGPLTPIANLRGRVDGSGYLRVSGGAYSGADGPLTPIGNLRGRTDANGYLIVSFGTAAIAPASGTCVTPSYTFSGDLNSGLGWLSADNIALCAGIGGSVNFVINTDTIASVTSAGLLPSGNNVYPLGVTGTRWTTGWFGTSVVAPSITTTNLLVSATAPTIASGGCTSPAVTWDNGTAAFKLTIGSSCSGVKTITLTLPAATNQWFCSFHDQTTPQSFVISSNGTSVTAVVLTNYARTTGLQIDFVAGEVLVGGCTGG